MASNISSRGTIENFLHQGITPQDAAMELGDNEFDAGAQTVVFDIDTRTQTLTVSGDGMGMDKDGMTTGLRINNTRPASEAIGLRGVGGKAGLAVLSGLESSALILSQMQGQKVYEVEIDWPATMREDKWAPTPSGLTLDNCRVWEENRIHPEHGTVVQVKMPQAVLERLLPNLAAELVRVYEGRLADGRVIRVVIDGVEQDLSTARALGYATAPHKQATKIQLLRNPGTGEMRGYLERDFHKKKVWCRKDGRKIHRDHQQALESGFECVGEFELLSAYDPSWLGCGYMSPCRNGRFLGAIRTQFPGADDYGKRKVVANSRHGLLFTQVNDAHIGVQVNKSAVSREDMNSVLLAVVDWAMMDFSTKVWAGIKPAAVVPPAEEKELKRRWKLLREACWTKRGLLEEFEARVLEVADDSDDEEEN